MKVIVVHHDNSSVELPCRPSETWGRLCQRYCERRLLHPPRLLPLLASLSPDKRAGEYVFRYGDGCATVIRVRWSSSHSKNGGEDGNWEDEEDIAEANLALRPRSGPLSQLDDLTPLEVAFPAGTNGKAPGTMAVELKVEKVGAAPTDDDSDGEHGDGDIGPFPLTQTPYPVDDAKTNVLEVKEHPRFAGVVDKFSLCTLSEWRGDGGRSESVVEVDGAGRSSLASAAEVETAPMATAASGRKRKGGPVADVAREGEEKATNRREKGENGAKKSAEKKSAEAKDDASNESSKRAKEATRTSPRKRKEKAPSKKEDRAEASSKKKKASKRDDDEEAPPKKKKAKPAKEPTGTGPTKKRARKSTGDAGKETESPPSQPAASVPQSAPAKSSSAKGRASAASASSATKSEGGATNGKKGKGRKEEKIKRPLNGYMRFCADVRPGVMRDNPQLKAVEVSKVLGERYRALGDDEKKRYTDAAREAVEQFKAEHPGLPLRTSKKKKAESMKEEEGEATVANDGTGEKSGAEEASPDAAKATKKKRKKIKEAAKDEGDAEDGEEEPAKERPKRPLSGYMRFMKEVLPLLKEERPDLKQQQIMSKAAEAYRELSEEERQRYKDAADAAMATFREKYGDAALKLGPRKKKQQRKRADSVGSHPTEKGMTHLPSEPAEGLPEGWVVRGVPRKSGDHSDRYWFSPEESYKFRSMAEVTRFRESLERADGDEAAAMKLYKAGEKEKGKSKRRKKEAVKEVAKEATDSDSETNDGGSDGSDEEEEPEAWGA